MTSIVMQDMHNSEGEISWEHDHFNCHGPLLLGRGPCTCCWKTFQGCLHCCSIQSREHCRPWSFGIILLVIGYSYRPTVGEHSFHVRYEEPLVHIIICLQPLRHGLHVHGELHMLIVVRYSLSVHRIKEWPWTGVVPESYTTIQTFLSEQCVLTFSRVIATCMQWGWFSWHCEGVPGRLFRHCFECSCFCLGLEAPILTISLFDTRQTV